MRIHRSGGTVGDVTPMRLLLARTGQSVEDFAKALGVSRVTANDWMRGAKKPSIKRYAAIADSLGVTVEELSAAMEASYSAYWGLADS